MKWLNFLAKKAELKEQYFYEYERYLGIIAKDLLFQDLSIGKYDKKYIKVPKDVEDKLKKFRPTPLYRLRNLEKYIGTKCKIYAKREDLTLSGSHKINTSIPQVFYAIKDNATEVVTDTGAGQWGLAVSLAASQFKIKSTIFMIKVSYEQKLHRVRLMKILGSKVVPSPSTLTKAGRVARKKGYKHGSLGIGMSEAIEYVNTNRKRRLLLGCMSNYAVLHQTIIGLETIKQCEKEKIFPDFLIGPVGGGSNFCGLVLPFLERFNGEKITYIAAESKHIPVLTKGKYTKDYQDYIGFLPKIKMYSLGHKFEPPPLYSGGLRYHGKNFILSYLRKEGIIKVKDYSEKEILKTLILTYKLENLLPAPETAHAIKAALDIAKRYRNTTKVIVFNFTGNGMLDITGIPRLNF